MSLRLALVSFALAFAGNLTAQCSPFHIALASTYNGSGVNAQAITSSNRPILGQAWRLGIDHGTFMPGAVLDFYVVALDPAQFVLAPIGEVLIGQSFNLTYWRTPGTELAFTVPNDISLCAAHLYVQGASWDGGATIFSIRLTDAIDGECGDV